MGSLVGWEVGGGGWEVGSWCLSSSKKGAPVGGCG